MVLSYKVESSKKLINLYDIFDDEIIVNFIDGSNKRFFEILYVKFGIDDFVICNHLWNEFYYDSNEVDSIEIKNDKEGYNCVFKIRN